MIPTDRENQIFSSGESLADQPATLRPRASWPTQSKRMVFLWTLFHFASFGFFSSGFPFCFVGREWGEGSKEGRGLSKLWGPSQ